jgi:lysine 2,3-aminomutase
MPAPHRSDDSAKPPSQRPTLGELRPDLMSDPLLAPLAAIEVPRAQKPAARRLDLAHRDLLEGEFWRRIPAYRDVGNAEFRDHRFQNSRSVTSVEQLARTLEGLVAPGFMDDVRAGMQRAPMNVRLSPYLVALIDWSDPYRDPLRTQFLPVASRLRADHPRLSLDSLHEQRDSPTPGLVHRYPDKALFLTIGVCPVYCRFCTRSYAIGGDTETVAKVTYAPDPARWNRAFAYLASRPEIEDVVVSGGDVSFLPPAQLQHIGEVLLAIPHLRRIRFATKGLAVMAMKILSHDAWTDALTAVSDRGRALGKEVALHTHVNHPREITRLTAEAMDRLHARGVKVRNQSVLIRGVNDDARTLVTLVRRLSYVNIQPYYVYQHDLVSGVEDLRTRVKTALELERQVRGATAGFNTPVFVNDVPGGGGKRDIHSFEHYDEVTGISVYRSPAVAREAYYLYFDPIHLLPNEGRRRWARPSEHEAMVGEALQAAGAIVPETLAV